MKMKLYLVPSDNNDMERMNRNFGMPNTITYLGYIKCNRTEFTPLINELIDVLSQKRKKISRGALVSKIELNITLQLEGLTLFPKIWILKCVHK